MKEIDKKLQEIAISDWHKFVKLVGEDKLTAAKVRYLRESGNSYGKISIKLDITVRKAEYHGGHPTEKKH